MAEAHLMLRDDLVAIMVMANEEGLAAITIINKIGEMLASRRAC